MGKAGTLLILLFTTNYLLTGQTIRIGLYNDRILVSAVFTAEKGSYLMTDDKGDTLGIEEGTNGYLSLKGDKLYFSGWKQSTRTSDSLSFQATAKNGYFSIHPVAPSLPITYYDDDLLVSDGAGGMNLVNRVDLEKYVAGVVRAEGGTRAGMEYYKTQSVLCRTYALRYMGKHKEEGFDLCDGVHCQAFQGKVMNNDMYIRAAEETRGLIIVDKDSLPIMAVFHANCGGQTRDALDTWITGADYLAPVNDPYCLDARNARWVVKIPASRWNDYLVGHGFDPDLVEKQGFHFDQPARKKYFTLGNDSLPFDQIRTDLDLKSSFFSLSRRGDEVSFHGRGYGHGVGLCQDGAIEMAHRGNTFEEIIKFYFHQVNIISMDEQPIHLPSDQRK
jgi:stage II sporulation protein D